MENKNTRNFINCKEEDYLKNKLNYFRYIGRIENEEDINKMKVIFREHYGKDFKYDKRTLNYERDAVKEMKFDDIIPYDNSTALDNRVSHFNIIFKKDKTKLPTDEMGKFEILLNNVFPNKIEIRKNGYNYTLKINIKKDERTKSFINYKNREIQYPISIVSYKRANKEGTTHLLLTKLKIEHYLFIEEQEYDEYEKWYDSSYCEIMVRPNLSKQGMGSTPMRNEIIDYWGRKMKFERCWILDDNITGYKYYNNGIKNDIESHMIFTSIEKHIEKINNAGIVSHNLQSFITEGDFRKCCVLNTKCYSSMLIPTNSFRFKYKYNEDVLISIENINDEKLITLCYNHILYDKKTSGTQTGGNQVELYKGEDGYKNKYEYLYNTLKELISDGEIILKDGKNLDDLIKCKSLKSKKYHHKVNYDCILNYDVEIEWINNDEFVNL